MKATIYLDESYINKNNECQVYLRAFIHGRYIKLPINISCPPENFDKKNSKIIAGSNKVNHNHIIKEALGKASGIFLKYRVNNRLLTREIFEKEFNNPASVAEFCAFMADQIKMRQGEITESSAIQQTTSLGKLRKFRKEILMAEMDEKFIREFELYLKNTLKNNTNTVHNTLKTIRTYVNRAIRMELMSVSPFKYYKLKKTETYPEFLTADELDGLFVLYRSGYLPKRYQDVLRWFLFACCTGLRISDLRSVKFENLSGNILQFKPKKTENVNGKRIEVPLTKKAMALIMDENPNRLKGFLFNCISEQRMNLYLKDIARESNPKIERNISFHTARHTFATNFLKKIKQANGILILQKLLGHSKIESTMIYAHVLEDDIKQAMEEFEK